MKKIILSFIILFFCFLQVSSAQYYYNRAFSFNGTSYAATIPGSQINLTGSFTIECWINPVNSTSPPYQILVQKRTGIEPNGYTLYLNQGKIAVRTNASTRLIGTTVIPNGEWTHVAATYNRGTNVFKVYVNRLLDGSITAVGPPAASTDSLRIAKGLNDNFSGYMDEIRVWDRERTAAQIESTWRMPLGEGSFGLKGAWRGNKITEGSGLEEINGYTAYMRLGATFKNYSNQPYSYLAYNTGVHFSGASTDFITTPHSSAISPTTAITLECWVWAEDTTVDVICSKHEFTETPTYRMLKSGGSTFRVFLNSWSNAIGSGSYGGIIPIYKWTHLAFTYNSTNGAFAYYMNGVETQSGTEPVGAINTNTSELNIGGGEGLTRWKGNLDELRISNYVKTHDQILHGMNVSIDSSNEPNPGGTNVVYNFEGTLRDYTDGGPRGVFHGNASFTNVVDYFSNFPAPINRWDAGNFADGFKNKYAGRTFGTAPSIIVDSLYVSQNMTISDINVFVSVIHVFLNEIKVELINPSSSINRVLFPGFNVIGGNVITIFDDQADSTLGGSMGRFSAPWSPRVKSANTLSIFNGQNSNGWWKLKITDNNPPLNNGILESWGLQFNNQTLVGIQNTIAETPVKYQLFQNYPNPFNPTTTIKFDLAKNGMTSIRIYDILGREVQMILNENLTAGSYELLFDGSSLSSGTYFYRIESLDFIDTKKMMLVK
jgi:subtilisin-like proprotein convertase family protein